LICAWISLLVSDDLIISASAAIAQQRGPLSVENVELLLKEGASPGADRATDSTVWRKF
jgi:hypothetical protein